MLWDSHNTFYPFQNKHQINWHLQSNNVLLKIIIEIVVQREHDFKNPSINWTLWVYAKLGNFRKRHKYFCFKSSFPCSANVKPTKNKNWFDFICCLHLTFSLYVYTTISMIIIPKRWAVVVARLTLLKPEIHGSNPVFGEIHIENLFTTVNFTEKTKITKKKPEMAYLKNRTNFPTSARSAGPLKHFLLLNDLA